MTRSREALANYAHDAWTRWMRHMFAQGKFDETGQWIMPPNLVQRWKRQLATPYEALSSDEQDSDRREAERILAVLTSIDERFSHDD